MKSFDEIIAVASKALHIEAEAVAGLVEKLDKSFASAVEKILTSKGRVVVTGIGKSAIIAQKITATLNSTGTPSIFMHAADAIHGDLGIIQKDDIVICLSKSGSTPEIKVLVPLLKSGGNTLIALVGNMESFLARNADIALDCTVEKEACPNNLAPTSSTTAQLALGDAIAVCLLDAKGFKSEDFAKYHPGGALGKRLYLKVGDISRLNPMPSVNIKDDLKSVIVEISTKRLGATAVLEEGKLAGVITDGDLRRMLQSSENISGIKAGDIMASNPKRIEEDEMAVNAVKMLSDNNITQLLVTKDGKYTGIVHLHDLLREGLI